MNLGRIHVISLLSGGGGLLAGGVTGYLLCRHRLAGNFEKLLDEEVAAIKRHYRPAPSQGLHYSNLRPSDIDPEDLRSSLDSEEAGFGTFAVDPDEEGAESSEDQEAGAESESQPEVSDGIRGDTSKPYDITLEQFTDPPDPGWQQITITYYAGDKILVDDQNKPIPDIPKTVGHVRLDTFGDAESEHPNLKYVRNHRLQADFEIILDERAYLDAVLLYGNPNRTE